jgi:hypothetical protein
MAAAAVLAQNVVGNYRIHLRANPRFDQNRPDDFTPLRNYSESGLGLFRFGQLGERAPKWFNALRENLGLEKIKPLETFAKDQAIGWQALTTLPRTPYTWVDAWSALKKLREPAPLEGQGAHRVYKAIHDVADAGAMTGHSVSMIASLFPAAAAISATAHTFADRATFVADVAEAKTQADHWSKANQALASAGNASQEIRETLVETKRSALLGLAKAVLSVAGFVLALAGIASPLVLLTISLAATIFALSNGIYKESMHNKPIDFFDTKHVQQIVAPAA